jgi:hypothetical protein
VMSVAADSAGNEAVPIRAFRLTPGPGGPRVAQIVMERGPARAQAGANTA